MEPEPKPPVCRVRTCSTTSDHLQSTITSIDELSRRASMSTETAVQPTTALTTATGNFASGIVPVGTSTLRLRPNNPIRVLKVAKSTEFLRHTIFAFRPVVYGRRAQDRDDLTEQPGGHVGRKRRMRCLDTSLPCLDGVHRTVVVVDTLREAQSKAPNPR